jgi:dienelactone hydrolase
VIVYAPTDLVYPALPGPGDAWTLGGEPVPKGSIPLDHVAGPVLAIAGDNDRLWPSAAAARRLMEALDARPEAPEHRALIYPGAGHLVGTFPYLSAGSRVKNHLGMELWMGGSRAADSAARVDGWAKVLAFMEKVSARR